METLAGTTLGRRTQEPSESTIHSLAQRALPRSDYDGGNAYTDLGEATPSRSPETPDDTSEVDSNYVKLLPDDAEPNSPEYRKMRPEVARICDLALETLTSAEYDKLSDRDRYRIAIAVGVLSETLVHRPRVLSVDGNYTNNSFLFYEFNTQQEADDYAKCLRDLLTKIQSLDVYCKIIGVYSALRHKVLKDGKISSSNKFKILKEQSGKLWIFVSEDGTVKVSDDNGEFPNA